jgi:hypothetical protein
MSQPMPQTKHQTPNARNIHDGIRLYKSPKMDLSSSR